MQEYVVDFPPKMKDKMRQDSIDAFILMTDGDFPKVVEIFKKQYKYVKKLEAKLPEGQKYHKAGALHNWGFFTLMQEIPEKVSQGYMKILLAYIEDLLDFETTEQAHNLPAYRTLAKNPLIIETLPELIQKEVEKRRERNQIPRDPMDILKPMSTRTSEALKKTVPVTLEQVRPSLHAWLDGRGVKEKRVFIGGSYKNIAILNHIADIVRDFEFVPIMPIDMPALSEPSYETLIHDTSLEMLQECSFAIFEVTMSNGHLMEIERARDFSHLKMILVYQTIKHDERPMITRMLWIKEIEKKGYRNFSELTTIIDSFLSGN